MLYFHFLLTQSPFRQSKRDDKEDPESDNDGGEISDSHLEDTQGRGCNTDPEDM